MLPRRSRWYVALVSEETASPATDGWKPAEHVHYVTLKVSVRCEHCSQPIPVNGPHRKVKCPTCLETMGLKGFSGALSDARQGMREMGSRYDVIISKTDLPECRKCSARVQVGERLNQHGPTTTLECQKCSAPLATYPVPNWLKPQFHGALQIFGGDLQLAGNEGDLPIDTGEDEVEPVAMNCPSCGAGLKIDAQAERTTTCEYCDASVFIPDALWKVLHPTPTQDFWTITYAKKPKKKKQKQKQQKNQQKQAPQQQRQYVPPQPGQPEPDAAKKSSPQATLWIALCFAMLLLGVIMALMR